MDLDIKIRDLKDLVRFLPPARAVAHIGGAWLEHGAACRAEDDRERNISGHRKAGDPHRLPSGLMKQHRGMLRGMVDNFDLRSRAWARCFTISAIDKTHKIAKRKC